MSINTDSDSNIQRYIENIEQSYQTAQNKVGEAKLAEDFFDRFFTTYPETQQFFSNTNLDYFGSKKLNYIYNFFADVLKHPNFAEVHLSQEVMRHQMYGLKDKEYYFMLIDSLVATIKNNLNEDWTNDMEESWEAVSQALKAIIQQAANDYL